MPYGIAINAGDTTAATDEQLTADQRGGSHLRVVRSVVDIGAFELQSLSGALTVTVADVVPEGDVITTASLPAGAATGTTALIWPPGWIYFDSAAGQFNMHIKWRLCIGILSHRTCLSR